MIEHLNLWACGGSRGPEWEPQTGNSAGARLGVTDVRGQPVLGVVQLLDPQVAPVRVVEAVVDGAARVVRVPGPRLNGSERC